MKKSDKLKAYSAAAMYFFTSSAIAEAQVIYVDIEPDTILDHDDEYFGIDLNDNDHYDFVFSNKSFYATVDISEDQALKKVIFAGAWDNFSNGIAARYATPWGFSYSFGEYFPYNFPEGALISESLSSFIPSQTDNPRGFFGSGFQMLASIEIRSNGDVNYNASCYWDGGVYDHYVGFRFVDAGSRFHYGWIRCDVYEDERTLVIKDYAYEKQANVPIIAGSTESYVPVQEHENSATISVYSFENKVIINTSGNFGNEISISVFDITGKIITTQTSAAGKTEIPVTVPEGMYIVEVTSEGNKFVKKVYL
jgi:hypothetical protein